MELKEGMFVRTKKGNISKIDRKVDDITNYYFGCFECDNYINVNGDEFISEYEITKASYNIIDLVQVGDYVNGYPVYEIIEYEDNTRAIVIGDDNKSIIWEESSQYIKSIVTKEQFKSVELEVK